MDHLVFLTLGLGNGAVFAALALSLVVTYRSSGVVNFGTGAIALYAAYFYAFLRRGQYFIPVPGLPRSIDLGGDVGMVPAMVISLLSSAALGILLYLLVFRPLRTALPAARAVASVGVMVVLQAIISIRLGTRAVSVGSIFPQQILTVAHKRIPVDRLYFALTILLVGLGLAAAFRYSRFGLATRAAAETEKGAVVSGISPDRIALVNWAISAMVAGLSGILISPIVPLVPVAYTLFIVPALAAALFGQFSALAPAVIGGLLIGMVQSEVTYLQSTHPSLPQSGLSQLVPLILIFGFLIARGRPLPTRGMLIQRTLGWAPRPRAILRPALVGGVVATVGLVLMHGSYRSALITSLIMGVVSLSLVVVTGYNGQISLAQLTLAGAGGFLLSGLTHGWGVPFPVAPVLAALGAAAVGVVIGFSTLRIRGLSTAVVSLALAVALEAFWFNNSQFDGGTNGAIVSPPTLFGIDLRVGVGRNYPRIQFGVLCVVVLVAAAVGVAQLRRSRLGSAMLAVRANERSAAAAGVNVARVKLTAFAIGAFIAGLGGALLAYQQTNVSAGSFTAIAGLSLFAATYLAGITSVTGGIVAGTIAAGGIIFFVFSKLISVGRWYEFLGGIGLIVTMIRDPEGVSGRVLLAAARRRARRQGQVELPAVTSEAAATRQTLPATAPSSQVLMSLDKVSVSYGAVVAVRDVSFDITTGTIVGLIGPNGAGKTTLIDAITGFTAMTGNVEFDGMRLGAMKPHRRVRAGLARTFQGMELYEDLSVAENMRVGELVGRRRAKSASRDDSHLNDVFDLLGLAAVRERPVRELSQGQRQLVSVARSLAGEPTLLLLDEPAGGLDSNESQWLAERLENVRRSGVTILLVDHDMNLVLNLCDYIHVLDFGSLIASGRPDQIRSAPAVTAAYLGTTHATKQVAKTI